MIQNTRVATLSFIKALWQQRELLWQFSGRQIQERYRGSLLGWGWSLITPLLMLGVYTFVFSEVFKARWGDLAQSGPLVFAINLFAGLIVFNMFSETASQAPTLIINNTNLVTKVVFPLEVLPAATVTGALFNAATSLIVLVTFQTINTLSGAGHLHNGSMNYILPGIPMTLTWLPLVWLPLILLCLALGWSLAALGVYLRDLGQVIGVAVNLMMFLSAVFYPLSALPARWQPLLQINPIVPIIEQTRQVAVNGQAPDVTYLVAGCTAGFFACELSYRAFQKARRGFADVL